jgi:hypothetical protein
MTCSHCTWTRTRDRRGLTKLGYRRFTCRDCGRRAIACELGEDVTHRTNRKIIAASNNASAPCCGLQALHLGGIVDSTAPTGRTDG